MQYIVTVIGDSPCLTHRPLSNICFHFLVVLVELVCLLNLQVHSKVASELASYFHYTAFGIGIYTIV